jgi:hypothetical protein
MRLSLPLVGAALFVASANLLLKCCEAADPTYSVTVRTLSPNGSVVDRAYLTLWRALEPDESEPIDRIHGVFDYYKPVIWEDQDHQARWVRYRNLSPNDGSHGRESPPFRFVDLPAGRYRLTVASDRGEEKTPDPTPCGASQPFVLKGEGIEPPTIDVHLAGSAPLIVRLVDADSHKPIESVAIRLRAADGMPIVHGHGSGNFFERTSGAGEVHYDWLRPGDYTAEVLGKPAIINQFVEYLPLSAGTKVRVAADGPTVSEIPIQPRKLDAEEIEKRFPHYVYGRVTDGHGEPMMGVAISAATGMGSLRVGDSVQTDADGRYRLYFGPGMSGSDLMVQAALFSAHKEGWYETNLNRQGDLLMSDQKPEVIAAEIKQVGQIWNHTSIEQVVFPYFPREVNFTLARCAVLAGKLISDRSRELSETSFHLTGEELPPGSSALGRFTTGPNGEFRIDGIPPGKAWRLGMRVAGTFKDVETEAFILPEAGVHRCVLSLDSQKLDRGAVRLELRYQLVVDQP